MDSHISDDDAKLKNSRLKEQRKRQQKSGRDISFAGYTKRWMQESRAMANHAFANGIKVPAKVMKMLEALEQEQTNTINELPVNKNGAHAPHANDDLGGTTMERLTHVHNMLATLVHPASPQTILLAAEETEKSCVFLFLGQFPIVRRMMFTACMCLVCLIGSSLSPLVNGVSIHRTVFDSSGMELFLVFVFLLSAAGMGASFSALFKLNHYIAQGTFDPKYETSYWIRFLVGLISGLILTQILSIDYSKALATSGGESFSVKHAEKVSMALLGGFSADLVFNILNRIVETVSSFVLPDKKGNTDIIERELSVKHSQRLLNVRQNVDTELTALKQRLSGHIESTEIDKALNKCMEAFDEG